MKNVMLDLETYGTAPGSVILSIGAVAFDPHSKDMGNGFYEVISIDHSIVAGFTTNRETKQWWDKQSVEARRVIHEAEQLHASHPEAVLRSLNSYLSGCGGTEVMVWGYGAGFDNALVAAAYELTGVGRGWKYTNDRCFRTIKAMFPIPKDLIPPRQGTYHNALDDAKTQAAHLQAIYKHHSFA